jgi:hypothetical protein
MPIGAIVVHFGYNRARAKNEPKNRTQESKTEDTG